MDTPEDLARLEPNRLRRHLDSTRSAAVRANAELEDTLRAVRGLRGLTDALLGVTAGTDLATVELPELDPQWGVRSPGGAGLLTDAAVWSCVVLAVESGKGEPLLRVTGAAQRRLGQLVEAAREQQAELEAAEAAARVAAEAAELRGLL